MKAICNQQYAGLKGVFDVGDEVEIESILTDTETKVMRREFYEDKDSKGYTFKASRMVVDTVMPKGSYTGFRIKSKNGSYYRDFDFICCIGYVPLSKIFKKAA